MYFLLIYFSLPLAKDSRIFSDIVDSMKTVQGNFQQTVVDNQGEIIQEAFDRNSPLKRKLPR